MKTNIWTKRIVFLEWNMTWTCSWDLHWAWTALNWPESKPDREHHDPRASAEGFINRLQNQSEWTAEDWTFSLSLLCVIRADASSARCLIRSVQSLCKDTQAVYISSSYICVCVCVWLCMHVFLCLFTACFNADLRRSTLDLNHLKLEELETGGGRCRDTCSYEGESHETTKEKLILHPKIIFYIKKMKIEILVFYMMTFKHIFPSN